MAAARAIFCELAPQRSGGGARRREAPTPILRAKPAAEEGGKIVRQPRVCTLRSYGPGERVVVSGGAEVSPFFASLAEYVESTRRSQDLEIVSGRLAMMAFAAAVTVEVVTGNSLFKKLDVQQIAEAGGVCLAVIASAATFAWFSSARTKIGQMFSLGCNSFVDSLIDNIVDGLFFDSELRDWSDKI